MNKYLYCIVSISLFYGALSHTDEYISYRMKRKNVRKFQYNKQSLSNFCRECCKDPNPSAECKRLCGNCEMYNDEGKSGANNFPGN